MQDETDVDGDDDGGGGVLGNRDNLGHFPKWKDVEFVTLSTKT